MREAARPGSAVGPYRLGPVVGRGGMAVVHEATHEALGRTVALKLLTGELASDAGFVERFRREGQMQAALEHPHVVTVYEAGTWEDGLFLAMQLVRGPTLAALIDRGALPAQRAVALHRQLAGALDAAHVAGLVHRDIKPRNVLVAPGDHAYLADFGLTKIGDTSGPTVTGNLLGTIAYLAPEVIRGKPATAAADRYAFAAMLFECLAGTVVFPRPTQAAMLYAHTNEPPPRLSARREELPAALDDVFARALSKEPASRPATATALVADVERILLEHHSLDVGPPPPPDRDGGLPDTTEPGDGADTATRATAPARPHGRALALAVGVLIGAAGGMVVAGLADDDTGSPPPAVAPLRGAQLLGADLGEPGRTRDCRGRRPTTSAPTCTIFQDRLKGATLGVPRAGVVRRWGVRSAQGELALSVLRRRGVGYFQTARSRNEFVNDDGPHTFATDLAVEAGDRLGLVVINGSAVGMRPAPGATTGTWSPPLRGDILPLTGGPAGELLFRVDYVPGGEQRLPRQVNGAPAARLPDGKAVRRRTMTMGTGVTVTVAMVKLNGLYKLDVLRGGRRVARMDVPNLAGPGRFVVFDTGADDVAEQFYVYMEWVGLNSDRVVSHYIEGNATELFFYD